MIIEEKLYTLIKLGKILPPQNIYKNMYIFLITKVNIMYFIFKSFFKSCLYFYTSTTGIPIPVVDVEVDVII